MNYFLFIFRYQPKITYLLLGFGNQCFSNKNSFDLYRIKDGGSVKAMVSMKLSPRSRQICISNLCKLNICNIICDKLLYSYITQIQVNATH